MKCVYCNGETKVGNSRLQKKANHVWRRRTCLDCGAVFTTSEAPELAGSLLVTRKKHVEPFKRDKLFITIQDSLKHRKTATSDATALTDTVLSRLRTRTVSGSIQRADIVATCLEILEHFDTAAAMHYRAFHPKSEA